MESDDLRNLYVSKSNDELLAIVIKERDSYTPTAIQMAERVLIERGVTFEAPEIVIPPESTVKETPKPFMPFVVGVCFVLLAFYKPSAVMDSDAAFAVNLTLNIFMRFVVIAWILSLVKEFDLSKKLWVILGLIFGGWALIVVNIVIWSGGAGGTPPLVDDAATDEETPAPNFLSCPACNHPLNGETECPECGLTLNA